MTSEYKQRVLHRRKLLLDGINKYWAQNYHPPTIRDLGAAIGGASTSQIAYMLERLVAEGALLQGVTMGAKSGRPRKYYYPVWIRDAIDARARNGEAW